jgi:hypothetical protein
MTSHAQVVFLLSLLIPVSKYLIGHAHSACVCEQTKACELCVG